MVSMATVRSDSEDEVHREGVERGQDKITGSWCHRWVCMPKYNANFAMHTVGRRRNSDGRGNSSHDLISNPLQAAKHHHLGNLGETKIGRQQVHLESP